MWKPALVLAALALPAAAVAAPNTCSQRTDVIGQLSAKFKEAPVAVGVANNGGLLEVLSTNNGSTWTIILTMPNGLSCLVAAGEDWQPTERVPTQAEEPQV